MEPKIVLRPGDPNDENRDYLPEAIKGSQMVVNENGNNSQPYPERLQEFTGDIVGDGLSDVWYEYIPESYDPSKKTPLVFSMHGGLMTGWGQCIYTSWTYVAEREGFICVFPSAHARRFWQIMCEDSLKETLSADNPAGIFLNDFPTDIRENHDANLVLALLERMKARYNIDESRVYMQGMSLGNAMTHMMSKFYAHKFAAMAGSAGPARKTLLFKEDGTPDHRSLPVDAWQTRMELDGVPPACQDDPEDCVAYNRQYWMRINQCNPIPKIRLYGENNFAFYTGKHANYVFRDVKNRDHGQTFDDAELVWDYLFSGASRAADGTIVHEQTALPQESDTVSLAAVAGCGKAWLNGNIVPMPGQAFLWQKLKYHGLNGGQLVRGEDLMLPMSFLAAAFGGSYTAGEDGRSAEMTVNGKTFQTAQGSIGAVVNNRITNMYCEAVLRDGELYIPGEWFLRDIIGYQVSRCKGGLYGTDHETQLSVHMTRLLSELLKG